ncbi:hypothetical protein D3C72_463370 [compost metagenome]
MFYANPPGGYKRGMRQPPLVLALILALAAPAVAADPLSAGRFESLAGAGGMLIAAPHGGYDRYSDDVARQVALATGAGYVLASGFRTFEHPWNVNRPTEGAKLTADTEIHSPAARVVYEAYAGHVKRHAPRLYVEIHGNSRPESAGWIEVATVNVPETAARALQADFRRRVSALDASYPRFDLQIEPLDPIHYRAAGAKRFGILGHMPRVVHMELPAGIRFDERVRSRYAWTIAQVLDGFASSLK